MKYVEKGLEVGLVKDEDGNYIEFEWRDVIGYEGYYLVSNYGHVKSKSRSVRTKGGALRTCKSKLKLLNDTGKGYFQVQLSRDGKNRSLSVHKLVYEAFIGLVPEGKNIDHIDRNPSNNTVLNLRALTRSENSMNRGSLPNTASKYKGVHAHPGHWKWRVASHEPNGKVVHIGYFELEGEAALAYNKYILEERGVELAVLNDLTNHDWERDRKDSLQRKNNKKTARSCKFKSLAGTQDQEI